MTEKEEVIVVSLDQQFMVFAKMLEPKVRDGTTITLQRIDYWMRQAKLLDDRRITMTDTGMMFFRINKTEMDFEEFNAFLKDLADSKNMDLEAIVESLCQCGPPGETAIDVPQYRDYYHSWKPKNPLSQ